ncbi:MAG TPA: DUF4412 domain-containing protein [Polyangia bacterium]|nr:DUF4412 domain-containing protein [Polyangia bacterium]
MKKTTKPLGLTSLALAAATFLSAGAARAAVTIVIQRGQAPATTQSTLYLDGDRMRVEGVSGPTNHDANVIVDGAAKKMTVLNAAEKSYMEITEEDMKMMRARVDAMRAQAEERMKNMPPEQRKQMEAMMAKMGAPAAGDDKPVKLEFKATGEKKTVNGFACEMYKVVRDGAVKEEDCISPWSAKVLQKSDLEGFRKFAENMAKSLGPMGHGAQNEMLDRLDKFPGLPITRHVLDGGPDEEIKSVKRGAIAASNFTVPAGYTKKELPMGGPMGGPGGPHHGGGMPMGAPPKP